MAERLLKLQEDERQYLAQELHDELGQSISAIKVMSVAMKNADQQSQAFPGEGNSDLSKRSQAITEICDHLYTVIRDLMKQLRPTVLDELGLQAALHELVENWQQRLHGVDIQFECDDQVEKYSQFSKMNLYRIVQECLTNSVKHADASQIAIKLFEYSQTKRSWTENRYIQLEITDNGKGFDSERKRFGYGLAGMRERAKSMGGQLMIESKPGTGTEIRVHVPLQLEVKGTP